MEKRLKPLKPDVLIWGPGPWVPSIHKDRENAKAFLQAMKAAVAPRNGRALFRTCPRGAVRMGGRRGCSNGAGCEDVYRSLLPEVGWELYDVFRLTEDLWKYIDREGHLKDRRLPRLCRQCALSLRCLPRVESAVDTADASAGERLRA